MKLVIVEDEEIIRSGLVENVKWRSLGIEVVGQAEDGQEAEELIDRTRPDIVVSDIRVPFVDGLTLAERVTEKYPGTAIVIISGHDDFDYARRAITIGVEDYILKPIDLDGFSDVLRRVCRKIEMQRREKLEVEKLRIGADHLKRILRERLVADLIAGRVSDDEARQILPDLFAAGTWFAALSVEIDAATSGHPDASSAPMAVQKVLRECVAGLAGRTLFQIDEAEGQFSLGAAHRDGSRIPRAVLVAEEELRARCAVFPEYTLSIGLSGSHEGPGGLKTAYRESREACACRYILGPGRTIQQAEVARLTGSDRTQRLFYDAELIWAVKLGDGKAIHDNLEQLLAEILRCGPSAAESLRMYVAGIFLHCLDAIMDEGGSVAEVFPDPIAVHSGILAQKTVAGAFEALEKTLREVAAYLEADRVGGQRHVVAKVKRYIQRNFGRSDLSLSEVAQSVHVSPSYLSTLFSATEGRPFVDYLAGVRIERAKDLLRASPCTAAEISDMVGYSSAAYFSSAFKRSTGLTPGDYRKNESSGR